MSRGSRPRSLDAELVALGIGQPIEDGAWRVAPLVEQGRAAPDDPRRLLVDPVLADVEVEVDSVLVGLPRLLQLEQDPPAMDDAGSLVDRIVGVADREDPVPKPPA